MKTAAQVSWRWWSLGGGQTRVARILHVKSERFPRVKQLNNIYTVYSLPGQTTG